MKRGSLVIVSLIVLMLVIVPLVSANVFTNFWNQITGNNIVAGCTSDWQCSSWSSCINGVQTRTCTDLNSCNNLASEPETSQSCTVTQNQTTTPTCGDGILEAGELCDYAAPLGPNNPYGSYCNAVCGVDGTTPGWLGCRGTGVSVCSDKVNSQYYTDHPLCIKNTDCQGTYANCNDNYCPQPTSSEVASYTCTDTDGGVNYYAQGTVTSSPSTSEVPPQKFTDYCASSTLLQEGSCGDNGTISVSSYSCPNGCLNGACVNGTSNNNKVNISGPTCTSNEIDTEDVTINGVTHKIQFTGYSGTMPFISPFISVDGVTKVIDNSYNTINGVGFTLDVASASSTPSVTIWIPNLTGPSFTLTYPCNNTTVVNVNAECLTVSLQALGVTAIPNHPGSYSVTLSRSTGTGNSNMGGIKVMFLNSTTNGHLIDFPALQEGQTLTQTINTKILNANRIGFEAYFFDSSGNQQVCGNTEMFSFEGSATTNNATAYQGNYTCKDSDGGNNPYVKGTMIGPLDTANGTQYGPWTDYCTKYGQLDEFSCGDGTSGGLSVGTFGWNDLYTCPNGCSNGVCLGEPNESIFAKCGNGVLDPGELCDYAAPLGPNNPYGSNCNSICEVSGTEGGWQGCRGTGVSVCSDKVTAQYFKDHPSCFDNTDCEGYHFTCNNNYCPPPTGNEINTTATNATQTHTELEKTNITCTQLGGQICVSSQVCQQGLFVSTADTASCCVQGVCAFANSTSNQTTASSSCQDGCTLSGKCYPIGYRTSSQYCSPKGMFIAQIQNTAIQCNNNFECASNICASHQCISQTLIQKIIAWFQSVFGGQ